MPNHWMSCGVERSRRARLWALVGVVVIISALVGVKAAMQVRASQGHAPTPIVLKSIPSYVLPGMGLTLEPPDEAAKVDLNAAEAAVRKENADAVVQEAVLARLNDSRDRTRNGKLAWVMTTTPRGTFTSTTGVNVKVIADIYFVDASSGQYMAHTLVGSR